MAKDTFFLRTTLTTSAQNYVSDNIDISAYTDPARGRVLVVDRAFITFSTDGQGPIVPADITSGSALTRACGAQVCSEVQTTLVEMKNNSLLARSNLYATADSATVMSMIEQTDSLNPVEFTSGFIVPTDSIHCGINTTGAWNAEIDVGFLFEVHTEKLSLQRIQELLVSLTAN
tara:strand:+ start:407 stop:928 length:522 start_codon:yes stop_codon:yes gene_type:complete